MVQCSLVCRNPAGSLGDGSNPTQGVRSLVHAVRHGFGRPNPWHPNPGHPPQALRLAARSVGRSQSALGLFYRRIKSRIGAAGAITATAHKLARLVYGMLKYGREYIKTSMDAYEAQMRAKQEQVLRRKASLLGFDLVERAPTPAL